MTHSTPHIPGFSSLPEGHSKMLTHLSTIGDIDFQFCAFPSETGNSYSLSMAGDTFKSEPGKSIVVDPGQNISGQLSFEKGRQGTAIFDKLAAAIQQDENLSKTVQCVIWGRDGQFPQVNFATPIGEYSLSVETIQQLVRIFEGLTPEPVTARPGGWTGRTQDVTLNDTTKTDMAAILARHFPGDAALQTARRTALQELVQTVERGLNSDTGTPGEF